ncbi:hypothetical protein [Nocardia aurantia]|nr:hypothetical protein [Nocardia aurantia]
MTTTDVITGTDTDRWLTGGCAVLVGALSVVMVPLYFIYSGAPPASNVLARDLITVVVFTLFLVWATGLRRLLAPGGGPAADIAAACGQVYAAVTLVSASLEAGVALEYPDGSKDPTVDGPLANGMALLHGPIARLLIATVLIALAIAVHHSKVLPHWVRTGSVLLAIVNLAFVPSLFFGTDPANFYAANGWGSTATIGGIDMMWIGAIGIATLRHDKRKAATR